jgi:acyl carrier protein
MSQARLTQCFVDALGIPPGDVVDTLAYNSIKPWDSVGHMALVAAIEGEFNVMLDTDEIIGMSTVAVARQTLEKRGAWTP